jgi:DNA-binding CsgD family transcriptional regulator
MYEAVAAAPEPLLVVQLPDERILQATDSARLLLAPDGADPIGRTLPDFLDAPIGGAAELLVRGRLTAVQLYRVRSTPPADDLVIWISAETDDTAESERSGAGGRPVLALLSQAGDGLRWATQPDEGRTDEPQPDEARTDERRPETEPTIVAGWADRQLLLLQVGGDTAGLLGQPAEQLIGRSLLNLFALDDLAGVLFALGHLAGSAESVSLTVRVARSDRSGPRCRLVLTPIGPSPACGFALQPVEASAADPLLPLRRFGQGIAAAGSVRELTVDRARSALSELTSRELQIVNRLLAGDRVPAISRQLYLAQSTVRNHLSAVFSKLGVRSQQELIVLLRRAQSRD